MQIDKSLKNRLGKVIDQTIAEFLATGEPTAREVADAVIGSNQDLVRSLAEDLAARQVRDMVYGRMKRVVELGRQTGEQFNLPFDVDDIPLAISFQDKAGDSEDEPDVRYISLARATKRHILSYEEILRSNIDHASKNLKAIEYLHKMLEPTLEKYPDVTIFEACEIFRIERENAE